MVDARVARTRSRVGAVKSTDRRNNRRLGGVATGTLRGTGCTHTGGSLGSQVRWHPKKEGTLAYATDDGRVSVLNTVSSSQQQLKNTSLPRGTVYSLHWGPRLLHDGSECSCARARE